MSKENTTDFCWKGRELFYRRIYVGEVLSMRPHKDTWRAWIMTDGDGESVSDQCETQQAARDLLVARAQELLS